MNHVYTQSYTERQLKNHTSLGQSIRNSFTMAYRGLLKIRRTPEQLFDVTFQPIIFTLMFTYIFGGAISGNVQQLSARHHSRHPRSDCNYLIRCHRRSTAGGYGQGRV